MRLPPYHVHVQSAYCFFDRRLHRYLTVNVPITPSNYVLYAVSLVLDCHTSLRCYTTVCQSNKLYQSRSPIPTLGFPKPGSFCKTGFSVLGKAKTGFRFRFRFWKSHNCVHCGSAGRGRSKIRRRPQCAQLIMYRWRLTTTACTANSLIDLMMGDLETFVKSLNA